MGDIGYCFIPFCHREVSALGEQRDTNKFTPNKSVISLLILSPNFPAAAKIVSRGYISVTSTTADANRLWFLRPWTLKVAGTHHSFQSYKHDTNVPCFCDLLLPCRLKKKSQSVDIASQGFSPTLVPASPLNKAAPPVAKTTTVLAVQENNTTNSQRRSPRCGELKRGYTIGNWHAGICFGVFFVFFLCSRKVYFYIHLLSFPAGQGIQTKNLSGFFFISFYAC